MTAVPLFGTAEGYYQGRFDFCVYFASRGVYDVSDDGTDRREVRSEGDRRDDRRRARRIHLYSAVTALAGSTFVYGVGLLL